MADSSANAGYCRLKGTEAAMGQLANALGKNIRAQRKAKGLSQDALALSCKIDRSYMGRIERGEVNLTVEKLYSIAGVLQCELGALLPPMSIGLD
ncbi:hypothetical protein Pres01_40330 [Metapseudomonas resinovorans]|nr:hypothetical protein Pres01_40330 [Pseudomonas resinovorans]